MEAAPAMPGRRAPAGVDGYAEIAPSVRPGVWPVAGPDRAADAGHCESGATASSQPADAENTP